MDLPRDGRPSLPPCRTSKEMIRPRSSSTAAPSRSNGDELASLFAAGLSAFEHKASKGGHPAACGQHDGAASKHHKSHLIHDLKVGAQVGREVWKLARATKKEAHYRHKAENASATLNQQLPRTRSVPDLRAAARQSEDAFEPQRDRSAKRSRHERDALELVGALGLAGVAKAGYEYYHSHHRPPATSAAHETDTVDERAARARRKSLEARAAEGAALGALAGIGAALVAKKAHSRSRSRSRAAPTVAAPTAGAQRAPAPTQRHHSGMHDFAAAISHALEHGLHLPVPGLQRPFPSTSRKLPPHETRTVAGPPIHLNQLTKHEHHVLRHAAGWLLLQESKLFRWIEDGVEHILHALHGGHSHSSPPGGEGALFGASLKHLVRHEGTDSHLGVGPGTVRVPTFVDHCLTAMMRQDPTVEGILRVPGKASTLNNLVKVLDNGQEHLVDLSALDQHILSDLFKRFLRDLPDPLLTRRLFKLFIQASRIENVAARRRAMHLVVCLMPKANRDLLEVVLLFLDWLSRFAHVTVTVGNKMNLTAIATVMAPTLMLGKEKHGGSELAAVDYHAMIAAVLVLLEDQKVLNQVPIELASVLHLTPRYARERDSKKLIKRLGKHLGGGQKEKR